MTIQNSDLQRSFLEYAIKHIENRISMIDQRSSILIAAQGIFFGIFATGVNRLFTNLESKTLDVLSYISVGTAFFLLVTSIFLLLKTIRPTGLLFKFAINPNKLHDVEYDFLYPKPGFCDVPEHYKMYFGELNEEKISKNYQNTNFILLNHLKRKMNYYRYAALFMKLLIAVSFLAVIVLIIVRLTL